MIISRPIIEGDKDFSKISKGTFVNFDKNFGIRDQSSCLRLYYCFLILIKWPPTCIAKQKLFVVLFRKFIDIELGIISIFKANFIT